MDKTDQVKVYQLRVYLRQISPMIWRRLQVGSDSTIADRHYTLQIAMGWDDFHLHQFIIRGKRYGESRVGGILFSDNPRQIRLGGFRFRQNERFLYEYDLTDRWQHEIRTSNPLHRWSTPPWRRLPGVWGEATTACVADSKQFGDWDQNLLTEWHLRYGGRGIMVYWHVEKNAACIYSQLKRVSSSEAAAMIQGVLRHCTEMAVDRQYVDSHGQNTVAFAFCRLLGFDMMPRLKRINRQKLYKTEKGQDLSQDKSGDGSQGDQLGTD